MLETVMLDAALTKKEYGQAMEALGLRLSELQRALRAAAIPALIVFEGWDAAGKGSAIGRLVQALDPRGYNVFHIEKPTALEQLYPPMQRFWNLLPECGNMAIYNHSWYHQVINEPLEADHPSRTPSLAETYERIRVFERQLADDGAVVLKFFLHISKKEQSRRFKELSKDPAYSWKVGEKEKKRHKRYDAYAALVEDMLRETSMPYAAWTLVSATEERFRNVQVAEKLVAAFEQALNRPARPITSPVSAPRRVGVLDNVDLSLAVSKEAYRKELPQLQTELRRLQHIAYMQRKMVVIVFEGWDAGGKGGAIRRMIAQLDPRGYEVVPVAAPEGEEKRKHHLWRFWRALRKSGHFTIFDRSWYGRVMVERVEGFAQPDEWMRAYREINEFETELVDYGAVVCKFWMHISKEEQLDRFEARQRTPGKEWKITEEDWRNREKWDAYWEAVTDMIEKTSTVHAPWTIVEGNDKKYARLKVLRTVVDRLSAGLEETK